MKAPTIPSAPLFLWHPNNTRENYLFSCVWGRWGHSHNSSWGNTSCVCPPDDRPPTEGIPGKKEDTITPSIFHQDRAVFRRSAKESFFQFAASRALRQYRHTYTLPAGVAATSIGMHTKTLDERKKGSQGRCSAYPDSTSFCLIKLKGRRYQGDTARYALRTKSVFLTTRKSPSTDVSLKGA